MKRIRHTGKKPKSVIYHSADDNKKHIFFFSSMKKGEELTVFFGKKVVLIPNKDIKGLYYGRMPLYTA